MNKKKKVTLFFAELLVLILAVGGLLLYIHSQQQLVKVYQQGRTIAYNGHENYQIQETDIVEAEMPLSTINPDQVQDKNSIIGKYLKISVTQTNPVSKSELQDTAPNVTPEAQEVMSKYRKITIPVDFSTALAGNIQRNDKVDLVFIHTDDGETTHKTEYMNDDVTASVVTEDDKDSKTTINFATAKIFMQDLTVFQVYAADGSVYVNRSASDRVTMNDFSGELDANNVGTTGDGESQEQQQYYPPKYVVLTVTPEQYEEIAARMNMGRVEIVGRFPGSKDVKDGTTGYGVYTNDNAIIYAGTGTLEEAADLYVKQNPSETTETTKTGIYSYMRDLAKVLNTQEELTAYAAVYAEYSAIMKGIYGTGWESADPDSITLTALQNAANGDTDMLSKIETFRLDLTKFAQTVNGAAALPQ